MLTQANLREGQKYLAGLMVKYPDLLLAVDMSLGKTISVLTAIRRLFNRVDVQKVLVVAPLRVARSTWPTEIEKWEHTRHLSYTLIRAEDDDPEVLKAKAKDRPRVKEKIRERLAEEDTQIHIINREAVPWLVSYFGDEWPYDCLVYDESSRLQAGRRRTEGGKRQALAEEKANLIGRKKPPRPLSEFGSLCRARKHIDRVIEMSGTPGLRGIKALWAQTYLLDLGDRLGTSRTAFERRWFEKGYDGFSLELRPGAEEDILERISDIMVGLRPEDHVDLPKVLMPKHYIDFPPKIMREYRTFKKTLVSEAYDVEAVSRGVLANKLLQFANGSMYRNLEDGRREVVHVHDLKLDVLDSIVEEAAGRNIMIAYNFKFDLERLKKKYPKAVVFDDEPDAVELWNKGKINKLLAHPGNIGHGLNLQFGGNIAVWYGLTNDPEYYEQLNMRLPRPGQPEPHVYIHHILARGTADEDVLESMAEKGATQDRVNAAARNHVLRA